MKELQLPNREGKIEKEVLSINDSLVIIGANGTGKSRLGHYIAANHLNTERISAQRVLMLDPNPPFRSYTDALQHLNSGNVDVTMLQNDYTNLLSVLFAKTTLRDSKFVELYKTHTSDKKLEISESIIEQLIRIWNTIFPHRKINFNDNTINAIDQEGKTYVANQLSDGERVAIYLIAKCMLAPEKAFIVIDEPELHLHKALMTRLWNEVEKERNDCLFIYITHELDFAASRVNATKIWLREYSLETNVGNIWRWDIVPDAEGFPENLLLEIIGSRKPILFVEGIKGSYDHAIYQYCYPNYTVIPREGAKNVITSTIAIRNNQALHTIHAYGLVDRDYRSDAEIETLKKNGIKFIEVAEVENLLLIPKILKLIAKHIVFDEEDIYKKVSDFILNSLENNLEKEISFTTSLEINFKLNALNTKQQGLENIKKATTDLVASIDFDEIYDRHATLYRNIVETKNYDSALKHYTRKGLLSEVSNFFGLRYEAYSSLILRLLKTDKSQEIISALREYLPSEMNLET